MKYLKKFNENLKVKTLVCKKDLYKSTYKSNAFTKGNSYSVSDENDKEIYLIDNNQHEFNFTKQSKLPFYFVEEYFEIT